ncbi:MAG: NAD-dependent epimerase/dehydratase family protein [Methylophilaceae bacterium]|jgi:UDP-glucose 4-epimerase|nr:NAD-dependent epimerase/dehydratase family protein [Methylophilaceae bacterium]
MSKYLVTGSTGFIGKRLLGMLSSKQGDVRLLSRSDVKNYETVVCDLQKDRIPKQALESVDTIFHLAGFAHDFQDPNQVKDLYQIINVDASIELARLAVENNVKRFVFLSSVKAGGVLASNKFFSESDQSDPEGVYGKSKREAELKLLEIGNESSMHMSIIRSSLVYGPEVKGNLKLMLTGIKRNWFPPLPKTSNQRSMIHVDDLVEAIFFVSRDKRCNGEIFIATDGRQYSSREIYNVMCGLLGKSIPKWSTPKIFFDIASMASPLIKYKINKLLGDESYSSSKLEALGFHAKKSLKDMNETCF